VVERANSSEELHAAITSFKKDVLPPSTAKIHEIFYKGVGEKQIKAASEGFDLTKKEVMDLRRHIEAQETGGYKGIRGEMYRACYKAASVAYNYFDVGVARSSSSLVSEMVDAITAKESDFVNSGSKNDSVTDSFKSHPLAFKGFSSKEEIYTVSTVGLDEQDNHVSPKKIDPKGVAFERFTGESMQRSQSLPNLEVHGENQKEAEGGIQRSKSSGDLAEPIDVGGVSIKANTFRDIERSNFQFSGGEVRSKNKDNQEIFESGIIQQFKDMGIEDDKISQLCDLIGPDLLDGFTAYVDQIQGQEAKGEKLGLGKRHTLDRSTLYRIDIEKGRLVLRAQTKKEVEVNRDTKGHEKTVLGSLSCEVKISLPLDKLTGKNTSPITQDDFQVTHTYGAFKAYQFGESDRLAAEFPQAPKGWMSKVYDALFDSAQVKAYKAISDMAVPEGLRNHPLESQKATLTAPYKIPILEVGNKIKLEDVNPVKLAWKDFSEARTNPQTVNGMKISGGSFTEIGRNKVLVGKEPFQTSEIADKSEEERTAAKREVVESVVSRLADKEWWNINQKHIPGLCNIVGQNLGAKISQYSRGAIAPGQESSFSPDTVMSYEFRKVDSRLEVIAHGDVTYKTDAGKTLGTQKIEVKVSLPLGKLQNGDDLTEDDFQVTHTYEAFKKSG
jgi:hypothetical protein